MFDDIEYDLSDSKHSGATYFAKDGRVYATKRSGEIVEAATALTTNGRELSQHQSALEDARRQKEEVL